jgi:hypothetical protein
VVACLPLDPRFAGSNPAEGDVFLRAIKSVAPLTSEGVKPSLPCRKILRHVKELCNYEKEILRMQNSRTFLEVFPASLLDVFVGN